jgi:hypothetical protein
MTMSEKTKTKANSSLQTSSRRELHDIIGTCQAISKRKFNPFFLDVKLGVETLRKHFPRWKSFEDHCLDAHALNMLAEVVRLQNTQLKFQSSTLYADPDFIARKVEKMSEKSLTEAFLYSWHPVVELEQLTNEAVSQAIDYWNKLLPIDERWRSRETQPSKQPEIATSETIAELGLQGDEFNNELITLWNELRQSYNAMKKPVDYWKFVRRASYQETVRRAHQLSYLVTYGFVRLQTDNAQLLLIPLNEASNKPASGAVSFPIPIRKEQ